MFIHGSKCASLPPVAAPATSLPDGYAFGFLCGRCHPSSVLCRARATVSFPAGASLVITDPAAMVAPSPPVTGATSDAFEPMKA